MTHARRLALKVLNDTQTGEQTLDQILTRTDVQIQQLKRADRGLFHAIVFGVLRWQSRLDWIIDHLASRPGKKIDPQVRIILRIGLFQMRFLDRIPTSAAVNTSVELSKKNRRKWAAGFVNSILRRAADKGNDLPLPARQEDPVAYLEIHHAFPRWLIKRWMKRWGVDETEQICKAINTIPKITLRTNTLRVTRHELMHHIRTEAGDISLASHSPDGITLSSPKRPLAQWDTYDKGWFQVQSEAAQCIPPLLSPCPGDRVWDVCSGLGTKTAHLAQLMKNSGHILATDISGNKLEQLMPEMKRLGISIVEPLQMDATQPPKKWQVHRFDRILIDAPCTGLGVLQRNPDGKWRNHPDKIRANSHRQLKILEACAPYLKPRGFMVYVVCSIEPEENDQVIKAFLQNHPEFAIENPAYGQHQAKREFLTPEGYIRTIPHHHQMDGFFAAVLKRI